MNRMQRSFAMLTLAGAAALGGFMGTSLLRGPAPAQADAKPESTQATGEQISKVEDLATVFRAIGHKIEPSVVNINVRKTLKGQKHPPMQDDMLRRFFPDRDGDGEPDLPPGFGPDGGDMEQIGTGSGVIIETDGSTGYIVTNNHVAGGAEDLVVTLSDGREIKNAKVLGADAKSDVAVVKIEAPDLHAAQWGDSKELDRGDWIMAFGSPFGYIGSMTHGIVSALNRDRVGILGQGGYENFIQVDAPINPGNSGGPLVNIRGEVVGINTAIASRSGGFQGIGFAIPSNQAKVIYKQLKEKGKVVRGWLGVSINDVARDQQVAESFGYKEKTGVLVMETFPDTPARGKLEKGDIIIALNGKKVENTTELRNQIAATAPNEEIKLTVFRDGKAQDVSIKLGEQPEDVAAATGHGREPGEMGGATDSSKILGMKLATLNDELREKYDLADEKSGALVVSVEPRSRAVKAGIRPGDLITEVGSKKVNTAREAQEALAKVDPSKGVRLYVTNRDSSQFRFIPAEK